ncbi:hypothetical protein SMACR_04181 [Sordaria macrospora]|uniref:WGS project CABT00000000 data, contig 2.15 n=2 Tax=Sordaria macrospora TaxID=5147 RepID=F7VZK4_SORMK|nr:uncharacterized protein SMAC_04181 [Sordaria macrospora k-hell]KAA8628929.1 hypothetical protein SMACR_04181 [Sordaria macrospora]WPJ64476.1 hypothetical protein SMAC4_04181 [Sordaria macrospora]CCC10952.1 unnamed protein product [Sordaria macrospora k-hell]
MPPKPAAADTTVYIINGVPVTASDLKLLCGIMSSLTAPIQADLEAAAAASGYTVGSFKKMWPAFKKKVNIESVSGNKSAATVAVAAAVDDNGEPVATPQKTPGGVRGGGRGRSAKKYDAIAMVVDSGGPSPLTPGVPDGMDALSVIDAGTGFETPDTPSKSTFGGMSTTVSSKKRIAAEQTDADADAIAMEEETPAKKKKPVARKPRVTAKMKREAAAAAEAALLAESLSFYDHEEYELEHQKHDPDPAADGDPTDDKIDTILAGEDGFGSHSQAEGDDVFTDACEI